MRRAAACALSMLLLGAKQPPPQPPPAVGVTVTPAAGARRADAVLPGHLLAAALPKGADGRRRLVVLTTPDDPAAEASPQGARSLYLIDADRPGAPRKLLDGLPAGADSLTAADLDGDGAEEILLGAPGRLLTLGSADSPVAPRELLEAPGLDLRRHAGIPGMIQLAEVGRLRTWRLEEGRLVAGAERPLPVRAARERRSLRLSSPQVTPIAMSEGAPPVHAVGPEENGKLRLRTLLLTTDGQQTESWSRLPGPETVDGYRYVAVDGRPALIVTTADAEKVGVFAKQRFRLFPLGADRSRSGQPPSLAFDTESNRWFPVDPVLLDLDRDGKQDLVVLQPEGLGGGDLVIDTFFGQGGGRFERPRRLKLGDLDSRVWIYGRDLTGDGAADLAAITRDGLRVFAGTADPRRALLDRRSRPAVALGGAQERIEVSVAIGTAGVETSSSLADSLAPRAEDLDGDGRAEILLFSRSAGGRGRVTVVRLGS